MNKNCTSNVLQWSEAYLIGHSKIDSEHKMLFELSYEILLNKDDISKAHKALKKLIKYTKYHFTNEEIYMKSINYKHLDEHKRIHKDIVNKLDIFIKNMFEISNDEIIENLKYFVFDSLINHILREDKKVQHLIKETETLTDLFQWKNTYKINHKIIDDEHKKLFDIAIKAIKASSKNEKEKKKIIKKTIAELYEYMKIHFEHEEVYMKEINYPDYTTHKKTHAKIIKEMNKFIKKIPIIGIEKCEKKLIEYIDVWLVSHILIDDRKIICYTDKKN